MVLGLSQWPVTFRAPILGPTSNATEQSAKCLSSGIRANCFFSLSPSSRCSRSFSHLHFHPHPYILTPMYTWWLMLQVFAIEMTLFPFPESTRTAHSIKCTLRVKLMVDWRRRRKEKKRREKRVCISCKKITSDTPTTARKRKHNRSSSSNLYYETWWKKITDVANRGKSEYVKDTCIIFLVKVF